MPKDEETRASLPGARKMPARIPGVWQAAVIAALSALVIGYWAQLADTGPAASTAAAANASRLAEVAPQDVTAALDTLAGSREQLAQFQGRNACSRRLAWVTVMRAPGQPPGRIRLQSGSYVSPAFDLGDTPARVAVPYPAPYAAGHGLISVLGTTTEAVVALTPPWRVPAQDGLRAREVQWAPLGDCPDAKK